METIKIHTDISQINVSDWDELAKQSQEVSFFQTKPCYDFYVSLSFITPFIYAVSEKAKLKALVWGYIIADGNRVKRFFSRRAISPGGVLLSEDMPKDMIHLFLKSVSQDLSKKGVIYIEMRNHIDYSVYQENFRNAGFVYHRQLNFLVDLTEPEQVFSRLSKSKQRQIKVAGRAGVKWEETRNENDIAAFYTILQRLYKTRVKRPLFPVEYIEKLVAYPQGKLLVVKNSEGTVIGGMACFEQANQCLYELFVCGSDEVFPKLYSSVMATWAGLEYSIRHNIAMFDFMGAGTPERYYGVREFKSKFGGRLVEYGRFLYICRPVLYKLGRLWVETLAVKPKV